MQIKNTVSYHLTAVSMTMIKRQEITNAGEDMEKGQPLCIVGGNVNRCKTVENSMRIPQNFKNKSTTALPCSFQLCSIIYSSQNMETI